MKKLVMIAFFTGLMCLANIEAGAIVSISEAQFDDTIEKYLTSNPSVQIIEDLFMDTRTGKSLSHYTYLMYSNGFYFKYSTERGQGRRKTFSNPKISVIPTDGSSRIIVDGQGIMS